MSFVLDTAPLEKRDRADFVHEALGATMVPIELHWIDEPLQASAHGVITDLGNLTVCCGRTTAFRVERTPALARDAMEPSIFINVQTAGTGMVVQAGREVVQRPGELVIYDSTAPYTLLNDNGMTGEFFRIPHSALALPHSMIRQACAMSLSPGDPLTSLTYDYLRRVAADPALFAAPHANLIAHPSIELIRAVIATHLQSDSVAAEPLANTVAMRILHYARTHLRDPDLDAHQIAAAHFISVRYLYKVLAAEGISLADWIRTHRLEACRQELTKNPTTPSIAAVAAQHGFTNMSSFSRAFRYAYGLSPSDWRDQHDPRTAVRRPQPPAVSIPAAPTNSATPPYDRTSHDSSPAALGAELGTINAAHPLHDTIAWMGEHARSPIDLAAIAKHAMVSKRTLNRQFRHHLNTTPLTVLAAIRVEHAKHLLDTTTLPVDRVAEQSGFTSYAALRYHFTRIVGVAPHHFRHGRTATTRPMSERPEPPPHHR